MDLVNRIHNTAIAPGGEKLSKISAHFFTSPTNLEYILGVELESGLAIVFANGRIEAIVSPLDVDFVKNRPGIIVHTLSKGQTIKEKVHTILENWAIKQISFEINHMTYGNFIKIFGKKNKLKSVPIDFSDLRRMKTQNEIQILARNAKKADQIFSNLKKYLKKNVEKANEYDVAKFIHIEAMDLKGKVSFAPIVASGVNGRFPHARPTKKIIRKNELITLDFGIKVDGMSTDMTRTVSVGKPKGNQQKVFDMVLEAQIESLKLIKEGNLFIDAHKKAIEVFTKYKVQNRYVHGIGHGLGIKVHEAPYPKKDLQLMENDVVTVEPGLYDLSGTGCRIEDTVVVTKNGYINLCKSKKDLII